MTVLPFAESFADSWDPLGAAVAAVLGLVGGFLCAAFVGRHYSSGRLERPKRLIKVRVANLSTSFLILKELITTTLLPYGDRRTCIEDRLSSLREDIGDLRSALKLSPHLLVQCTSLQTMTASLIIAVEVHLHDEQAGPTIAQLVADIDSIRDALCKLFALVDSPSTTVGLQK